MGELLEASGLMRPLSEEELFLLQTLHEPFIGEGRFPIFDFVERRLYDKRMDAAALLAGLPATGDQALYGLVWPVGHRHWRAEEEVRLTFAGLVRSPRQTGDVDLFLSTLAFLVERERLMHAQPYEVVGLDIPSDQIRQHLQSAGFDIFEWTLHQIRALMTYEPPDATSGTSGTPEEWTVRVSKDIRNYRNVTDVSTYLERVVEHFVPVHREERRLYGSPFTLPEVVDYLDVVWQLRFAATRLFRLGSAASTAALVFPCSTEDEFKSRVSGLADLLGRMDVPETPELPSDVGSLVRLETFLGRTLPSPDLDRIRSAIGTLRAIVGVRTGGQHTDAQKRQLSGYARLGISYPVHGWGAAWDVVQDHAIEALEALREEIGQEPPPSDDG
jgi:hypothetical protein